MSQSHEDIQKDIASCGYHKSKFLGSGSFGEVYDVGNDMVYKYVLQQDNISEPLTSLEVVESYILKANISPHLLGCKEIITPLDCDSQRLSYVLPKFDDDLIGFVKKYQNKPLYLQTLIDLFYDVACGLKYLHYNNILHRDIKPDNILVKYNNDSHVFEAVLSDFGLCCIISSGRCCYADKYFMGTPFYMSPDIVDDNAVIYTREQDLWSLGISILVCLNDKFFINHNPHDLRYHPELIFEALADINNNDLYDLIYDALNGTKNIDTFLNNPLFVKMPLDLSMKYYQIPFNKKLRFMFLDEFANIIERLDNFSKQILDEEILWQSANLLAATLHYGSNEYFNIQDSDVDIVINNKNYSKNTITQICRACVILTLETLGIDHHIENVMLTFKIVRMFQGILHNPYLRSEFASRNDILKSLGLTIEDSKIRGQVEPLNIIILLNNIDFQG